jgi:serine phosphatase RsbU (regulator of sigma subunit)
MELRSNNQESLIGSEVYSKNKIDSGRENSVISDKIKLLINGVNVNNMINNKYSKNLLKKNSIKNNINIYKPKQESLDKKMDKEERKKNYKN